MPLNPLKKIFYSLLIVFSFSVVSLMVWAEEQPVIQADTEQLAGVVVDYRDGTIIDSDLDGLTDQGEIQLYGTDPQKIDTDSDGLADGAEIIGATDPLDPNNPVDFSVQENSIGFKHENPWIWYLIRSAGILAFVFLWLTAFLGLAIRNPWLKKIVTPVYSFDFHCFTAASSLFWATVHGASLLLEKTFPMNLKAVLVPFAFRHERFFISGVDYLALGIIAFYLMVVLVATSYGRKWMSHGLWRALHFLNPLAFLFVIAHAVMIGTDLQNPKVRWLMLASAGFLMAVALSSIGGLLLEKIKQWHVLSEKTKDE